MDLHAAAHSPTLIRRPMAKAPTNVIKGGGLPRNPMLPSIPELADSSGGDPNAATRAIEDLKRSGYQPLGLRPAALQPLSSPQAPPGPTRHGVAGDADSMLKYSSCQTRAEGDGRSVLELEVVAGQHRIPTG